MSGPVAVILAAGKSTRMKSDVPKVLHEVCGRPLIHYVLESARAAGVARAIVVVGYCAEQVEQALAARDDVEFVVQAEQLGTAHAVEVCTPALASHQGPVLVLAGDAPLIRGESLRGLLDEFQSRRAACVLGTAVTDETSGFGRIVRDLEGNFLRIVEEKDATPEQKAIREINLSCYVFDKSDLFAALAQVRPANVQRERYLTDVPELLRRQGKTVLALARLDAVEALGVNTRRDLAKVIRAMQDRIQARHLAAGVTIIDPASTMIDDRAAIGADTVIAPFTVVEGSAEIGVRCRVGPFVRVTDGACVRDGAETGSFVVIAAR